MDCIYSVTVPFKKDGFRIWSLDHYHNWLKMNSIIVYCGGLFSEGTDADDDRVITFSFPNEEDAMAFKLRWM